MRHFISGAALGLVVAALAWFLLTQLGKSTDVGSSKRMVADIKSISDAVEEYRVVHGRYPMTARIDQLREALQPHYLENVPTWGLGYCSDGVTFAIWDTPFAREATGPQERALFHVVNGKFVSWPDYMGPNPPSSRTTSRAPSS